jgi:hypothetical protein
VVILNFIGNCVFLSEQIFFSTNIRLPRRDILYFLQRSIRYFPSSLTAYGVPSLPIGEISWFYSNFGIHYISVCRNSFPYHQIYMQKCTYYIRLINNKAFFPFFSQCTKYQKLNCKMMKISIKLILIMAMYPNMFIVFQISITINT